MDDLELRAADLPDFIRTWLVAQPAMLVSIEQREDGGVLIRRLPDVDPQLVERVRVTMAKYRAALMNLT